MQVKHKIISIVGPTATGKTKRALEIAKETLIKKEFSGVDIISVDSRQVYRGLEVLTGADVPNGFIFRKNGLRSLHHRQVVSRNTISQAQSESGVMLNLSKHGHNQFNQDYFGNDNNSIRLFGVSIINQNEDWSVAHFRQMAREIIKNSWQQDRLVILVGGTGLYHKHLLSEDHTLTVPPNPVLRAKLELLSLKELQTELSRVDSNRFNQMNQSDKANKRRLIRAVEVVMPSLACPAKRGSKHRHHPSIQTSLKLLLDRQAQGDTFGQAKDDTDWTKVRVEKMFLTAPLTELEQRIKLRVVERFSGGAVEEVKILLGLKLISTSPVLFTLGVPEISKYLTKKLSAQETIDLWALREFQYAKRQLTWWKKQSALFK